MYADGLKFFDIERLLVFLKNITNFKNHLGTLFKFSQGLKKITDDPNNIQRIYGGSSQ
jgi:hypothetical protein